MVTEAHIKKYSMWMRWSNSEFPEFWFIPILTTACIFGSFLACIINPFFIFGIPITILLFWSGLRWQERMFDQFTQEDEWWTLYDELVDHLKNRS